MAVEKRSNTWTFVVYPDDSLPENYLSIILSWHIAALLSPVHDSDLNGDESEKKKHIHIMLYFGTGQNKSFNQVSEFTSQLNGTIPLIVHNTNALIRYFIHLDNPEKHQYSMNDLISVSGFQYHEAFENYTSEQQLYQAIEEIINKEIIYNYAELIMYLNAHNMLYESMFVRKHTFFFNSYLNGIYQKFIYNKNN